MKLNIWLLITAALFSFIGINSKNLGCSSCICLCHNNNYKCSSYD
jgi:hypothetical protein